MIVYDNQGLTVYLVDGDAVAVYISGRLMFECTLNEWMSVTEELENAV